ncbi:MAG: hypothetical protein V1744_01755 [Candidatus Altiarchaeota archaeon]
MSEKDGEIDVKLDGELTARHLLALILEVNAIKASEAARKMQVSYEKILEWGCELRKEGLIEMDDSLGDTSFKITKQGIKKLRNVEAQWLAQETACEGVEKKPKGDTRRAMKLRLERVKGKISLFSKNTSELLTELWEDIILLASVLLSLKLLTDFVDMPNEQALNFLLGSILISLALLLYHQYKKSLKTAKFVGFMEWVLDMAKTRRRPIALVVVAIFMIYSVGMLILNPENMAPYLILTILVASTVNMIYSQTANTVSDVFKFYVGVLIITSGLLMIAGMISVTGILFGSSMWVIDAGFGLGLLVIAYLNEKSLGVALLIPK